MMIKLSLIKYTAKQLCNTTAQHINVVMFMQQLNKWLNDPKLNLQVKCNNTITRTYTH